MRPSACMMAIGAIAWMVASAPACSRAVPPDADLHLECSILPSPPVVGQATVDLDVTDSGGNPIEGSKVHVEGNMNHPGMVPSFASAEEVSPGHYRARIDFTMGGDWFLLVEVGLRDGRKVERTIPVPSVRGR